MFNYYFYYLIQQCKQVQFVLISSLLSSIRDTPVLQGHHHLDAVMYSPLGPSPRCSDVQSLGTIT
jgi:hypothetical protein